MNKTNPNKQSVELNRTSLYWAYYLFSFLRFYFQAIFLISFFFMTPFLLFFIFIVLEFFG